MLRGKLGLLLSFRNQGLSFTYFLASSPVLQCAVCSVCPHDNFYATLEGLRLRRASAKDSVISRRYRGTIVAVKRLREPLARMRSELVYGSGTTGSHETISEDLRPASEQTRDGWNGTNGFGGSGSNGRPTDMSQTFGYMPSARAWSNYIR